MIVLMKAAGMSQIQIYKKLGMSEATFYRLKKMVADKSTY
jgi:DNA-binding CsgD family transcriptional regulator